MRTVDKFKLGECLMEVVFIVAVVGCLFECARMLYNVL